MIFHSEIIGAHRSEIPNLDANNAPTTHTAGSTRYKRRRVSFELALLFVLLLCLLTGSQAQAYQDWRRWPQGTPAIFYSIDPNLDTALSASATNVINNNVVPQWNLSSWLTLLLTNYSVDGNGISVASFTNVIPPHCNGFLPDNSPASTCVNSYSGGEIFLVRTYFNISGTWHFNTSGFNQCSTYPKSADVQTYALHEFGHWYELLHDPTHTEAVMWPDCPNNTSKQTLKEDDKQGVVQMYGPRTGWEANTGYAYGLSNSLDLNRYANGYYCTNSPGAELGVRTAEFNVPVFNGSQYEMLAGCALSTYSYSYMRLFTWELDNNHSSNSHYLTITSNTKIRWYQYNYIQNQMSIDFEMTDGTTLRDSGLRDQNNVSVHPVGRGSYGTGSWFYVEVNLSSLANKTIQKWWVAYDNGANGFTGPFRAYFDNFRIQY